MPVTVESPSPVPLPSSLVVKNGSKIFSKTSGDIPLPVSATSTEQNYYFMPTENLPLLEPVRAIPLIGNPIADLVQPVLKAIVDLGYGDAAHGYPSGGQPDANVLVPFGLFPQVDPLEVAIRVFNGIGQGITDFINDFGPTGSVARELSSIQLPSATPFAARSSSTPTRPPRCASTARTEPPIPMPTRSPTTSPAQARLKS